MTLITRLATSFTDTTIPKLVKDPVIPSAGARLLVDMKSVGTWPSQGSSLTTSDQVFSLVDNNWPTLSVRGTHAYDATRGGLQGNSQANANTGLWLSDASTGIFNDATAAWAFTFWMYRGPASGSASYSFFQDQAFELGASASSGPVILTTIGADGTRNEDFLVANQFGILLRFGFTVYQIGTEWKWRSLVNTSVSPERSLSGATNTAGGAGLRVSASGTLRPRVFPLPAGATPVPNTYLFYRAYAENLTLSGRTFQQVFDADWARGNGRYS
jgi:hypothetical protein